MRKSVLAAAAAISMMSLGSGAVAQSAAPLSLASVTRPDADLTNAGDLRGGFILPTLAIIVIGVLIYVVAKGGNDNPASP